MNYKILSHWSLRKIVLCIGLPAIWVLASGCATEPDRNYKFGRTYRNILAAQVLNWGAPNDPSPVEDMPGLVSEGIYYNRYLQEIVEQKDEDEENDSGGI